MYMHKSYKICDFLYRLRANKFASCKVFPSSIFSTNKKMKMEIATLDKNVIFMYYMESNKAHSYR